MKRSCGKFMKYAALHYQRPAAPLHGPLLRCGTGGGGWGEESELSGESSRLKG